MNASQVYASNYDRRVWGYAGYVPCNRARPMTSPSHCRTEEEAGFGNEECSTDICRPMTNH